MRRSQDNPYPFGVVAALIVAVVAMAVPQGCTQPIHLPDRPDRTRPVQPDTPDVKPMERAALCAEIARYINPKDGPIRTTDDLSRVFLILADAEQWSKADAAAVDEAIPDLVKEDRALTEADAKALRGVK